jgi:hypothetical protein
MRRRRRRRRNMRWVTHVAHTGNRIHKNSLLDGKSEVKIPTGRSKT